MTDTLCFGCRAIAGEPKTVSDMFPDGSPPPGMVWQVFECEACGVNDMRLVVARPLASGDVEAT